jgi:hypothetical protein
MAHQEEVDILEDGSLLYRLNCNRDAVSGRFEYATARR